MSRFVELSCAREDPWPIARAGRPRTRLHGAGAGPLLLGAVAGLAGIVVDAPVPPYGIVVEPVPEAVRDRAVLVRTGWDRRSTSCPYLAEPTVSGLLTGGAALVGLDFPCGDARDDPARVACERLLSASIVVVEGLCNLSALPAENLRFFAVPLSAGSRPLVRAFAELLPP
jgi:arylformamidase